MIRGVDHVTLGTSPPSLFQQPSTRVEASSIVLNQSSPDSVMALTQSFVLPSTREATVGYSLFGPCPSVTSLPSCGNNHNISLRGCFLFRLPKFWYVFLDLLFFSLFIFIFYLS